jgi:predicted membrane channel-forming protein YqfA (hemolysin III family)
MFREKLTIRRSIGPRVANNVTSQTDHWYRGAACVDYVGISGLIAASVISIEHYGFYCEPNTAAGYMVFSGVCGVIGMILPWVSLPVPRAKGLMQGVAEL